MKYLFLGALALLFSGCATNELQGSDCDIPELTGKSCVDPDLEEISKQPFGLSGKNPIKADGPSGQRDYLSRLICPSNRSIKGYSRIGSVGISPYGFMMDLYEVDCGKDLFKVYIDMYHTGHIENKPIEGFTIKH